MYRYISLIWNEADGEANQVAEFLTAYFDDTPTDWDIAYEGAGLRVLHTGEEKNRMQAYSLLTCEEGSGGVVLGKLFDRPSDPAIVPGNAELNTTDARKIVRSEGRCLVDRYWGSWVAFFQDRRKKYVLVDPIGTFCCFSTNYRGVDIYFTYMNDIAECDFLRFSINWIPLARQMRYSIERTETGLSEVAKILSGQCLQISPCKTEKKFYWNPQAISQTDIIKDVDMAAAALRLSILTATAAWAAPYDKVLHQIGGLDSSILLACLAEVPTELDITAFNLFHKTPAGDERYYVRQATKHIGVPLIEYSESTTNLDFDAMSKLPLTTVPVYYPPLVEREKDIARLARENGIQATFDGTGGDEILYASESSHGAIDYFKSCGLRPTLLRLIWESARLQNVSIWSILPKMVRDSLSNKQWDFYKEADFGRLTLLSDNIQELAKPDRSVHPWIKKTHKVPPGKYDHILPYTMGSYARECGVSPKDHIPIIYPLLSQPLIELCLRIPSWVMTADGKSRGLARKAFQYDLPAEVVWRTSKAAGNGHHDAMLRDNFAFFRDFLLGGIMVHEKIVNKSHLEKILVRNYDIGDWDRSRIIHFMNAEIWARKWRGESLTQSQSVFEV